MMLFPKYAENVIVGVKFNNDFNWYVSYKELWYLDLRKLTNAYVINGYADPNPEDFSERFNIDIVNENNAKEFLSEMNIYIVKTEELSSLVKNKEFQEIEALAPSFYVDFDKKKFISYFPEPEAYEEFIPDNWCGKYRTFDELIPDNHKYWIIDGKNYWKDED